METLEIKKDAAIKAYNEGGSDERKLLENLFGKKTFSRKPTEWIKTFGDVCEAAGVLEADYIVPENAANDDKAVMQLHRMRLICKVFNGDWVPRTADTSQYKYYPWFRVIPDANKPSGFGLSYYDYGCDIAAARLGSRLYFKDSETAIYVGKTFITEYEHLFTY